MGMVLSMILCLNLSACAAKMNGSGLSEGTYESSSADPTEGSSADRTEGGSAGQTDSSWWGSGSSSGTQMETILDWLNKYPGSQEGESGESEETPSRTCSAPTNVTVTSSMSTHSRTMKFSWDKVEGADKYILQLCTNSDFTGEDLRESTTKDTQYKYSIRSGAAVYYYPAHRTYYFRIKAVSGNYESEWSDIVISKGDAD